MTDLPHINKVATYTTMSLKVAKRHLPPQPSPYMTSVATLSDLLSDINHNKTHTQVNLHYQSPTQLRQSPYNT